MRHLGLVTASVCLALSCGRSRLDDASALSQRPVAVISVAVLTASVGTSLSVSGEASYDPLGEALTYSWVITTRPEGSAASLDSSSVARVHLTPDAAGTWELQLVVSAGKRVSDPVAALLTIEGANTRPDAGPSQAGSDAGRTGVDGGVTPRPDAGTGASDAGPLVLDPSEVYLFGTLSEGACYRDALAHWSTPNLASVGFDCYAEESGAIIRPSDGRLLYTNTFEDKLREYHCDDCAYTKGAAYPSNVLANDSVIDTPCPVMNDRLSTFRVTVDSEILYSCNQSSSVVRSLSGTSVYDGTYGSVIGVGDHGWLLVNGRAVNYRTGAAVILTGASPLGSSVARWSPPDGFWLVFEGASSAFSLYRASLTTGEVTLVGDYPQVPAGLTNRGSYRLDRAGRLFLFASNYASSMLTDVIVRSEVGGAATVVYTEATNPLVKIHISSLVTAP